MGYVRTCQVTIGAALMLVLTSCIVILCSPEDGIKPVLIVGTQREKPLQAGAF
jgi:hypothetical protein